MIIDRIDHLVLTVRNIEATCEFYARVLGFEPIVFGNGRRALRFGDQKINLHAVDATLIPHAINPTPGSADLCFVTSTPMHDVIAQLLGAKVELLAGPIPRTGATGQLLSVYFRDPDGNLIEVSNPMP